MRKLFIFIIAICIILTLVGCNNGGNKLPGGKPPLTTFKKIPVFPRGMVGSNEVSAKTVNTTFGDYRQFQSMLSFCRDYNAWILSKVQYLLPDLISAGPVDSIFNISDTRQGVVSYNGPSNQHPYTRVVTISEDSPAGFYTAIRFMSNADNTRYTLVMANPTSGAWGGARLQVYELHVNTSFVDNHVVLNMYSLATPAYDRSTCLIELWESGGYLRAKTLIGSVDTSVNQINLLMMTTITDKTSEDQKTTARLWRKDFIPLSQLNNYLNLIDEVPDSPGLINDVDLLAYYSMTDPDAEEYGAYPSLSLFSFINSGVNASMFETVKIDFDLISNLRNLYPGGGL